MKIMVCGSMTFAKEMLDVKKKLEAMGHIVDIPTDAEKIASGRHDSDDFEANYKHCVENDIIRVHFKILEKNDAILILNYDKDGVKGYIGASSLMEIGLAYHFGKKIFLLYPPPEESEQRWAHEIRIMNPTVINGNLSLIKN
jgi:hypothetical protein